MVYHWCTLMSKRWCSTLWCHKAHLIVLYYDDFFIFSNGSWALYFWKSSGALGLISRSCSWSLGAMLELLRYSPLIYFFVLLLTSFCSDSRRQLSNRSLCDTLMPLPHTKTFGRSWVQYMDNERSQNADRMTTLRLKKQKTKKNNIYPYKIAPPRNTLLPLTLRPSLTAPYTLSTALCTS